MFITLVRKELLNNLLNLRFALAYFMCTLLLVGSAAIMLGNYLSDKRVSDVNKKVYTRELEEISYPWEFLWANKKVVREHVVTRIFALGGEKDADQFATVAPEFSPYFHGEFKRNPLINLFPLVDTAFIVGVIISLLVLVLTYDSISGEYEEGTLKVLLSCPIARDKVILAKWVGGFFSLVIPFVMSSLIILIILVLSRNVTLRTADWQRIIAVLGMCVLYIAAIFSFSMMASVVFRRSTTGILFLLLVWVIGILAVPAVSTPLAHLFVAPPAPHQGEVRMLRIGVLGWSRFNRMIHQEYVGRFGSVPFRQLEESRRTQWRDFVGKREFEHIDMIVDSIILEGQHAARIGRNVDRAGRWIARLSPYGCFHNACVALAGTGMQRRVSLQAGVEEYSRRTVAFVKDVLRQNSFRGDEGGFSASHAPRPEFSRITFVSSLQECLVDIAVLAAMTVLFFMVAYVMFLRMEIT